MRARTGLVPESILAKQSISHPDQGDQQRNRPAQVDPLVTQRCLLSTSLSKSAFHSSLARPIQEMRKPLGLGILYPSWVRRTLNLMLDVNRMLSMSLL